MTTAADIIQRESDFWQAMVRRDARAAAAMLTPQAANVAMHGIHHFSPDDYVKMAEAGPARLTSFAFSNPQVLFPAPGVAIVTYEVKLAFDMNGQPHEMRCFDSTTWVEVGGKWLAAVHTETQKQGAGQTPGA